MKRRGRPPRDGEPATEKIRVRVTPAQRLAIRRVAEKNDTDMAGVIREAVNIYCADCGDEPVFRRPPTRKRP